MYLIWSFEHNAWWKSGGRGYTTRLLEAGMYNERHAIDICNNANFGGRKNEEMRPVSDYYDGQISNDWRQVL